MHSRAPTFRGQFGYLISSSRPNHVQPPPTLLADDLPVAFRAVPRHGRRAPLTLEDPSILTRFLASQSCAGIHTLSPDNRAETDLQIECITAETDSSLSDKSRCLTSNGLSEILVPLCCTRAHFLAVCAAAPAVTEHCVGPSRQQELGRVCTIAHTPRETAVRGQAWVTSCLGLLGENTE